MKDKFYNGKIKHIDESNKVIHFEVFSGTNIFSVAGEAIAILADNPQYAAIRFSSNCGSGVERDYVIVAGMTLKNFEEQFSKEEEFSREKYEEAKELTAGMPQQADIAKHESEILGVKNEILKLEEALAKLRKKEADLEKQKTELSNDVFKVEQTYWLEEMRKYYATREENNIKLITEARVNLENSCYTKE